MTYDECFSWRLTQFPLMEMIRRTAADVHPPLYYIVLRSWLWLWGSSTTALLALSTITGVLSVAMLYITCAELYLSQGRCNRVAISASLLGALVCAIHSTQVMPGRTARMYSMCILLTALSAWLMLRAMRARDSRFWWWTAYGIVAAIFGYTHYYALFTVGAQFMFCTGEALCSVRLIGWRAATPILGGMVYALTLALALYIPWIPMFLSQVRAVHDEYWIQTQSASGVARMLASSVTGVGISNSFVNWLCVGGIGCASILLVQKSGRPAMFFLSQAIMPWALAILASYVLGRSILYARYMVFAHVGFVGLVSVCYYALKRPMHQMVVACAVCAISIVGLRSAAERALAGPPAIALAAEFLKEHYREPNMIIVDGVMEVNRLRFYAANAGLWDVNVRTVFDSFSRGPLHIHEASLALTDIWSDTMLPDLGRTHWWLAGNGINAVPSKDVVVVSRHEFEGGDGSHYTVMRCETAR